jgi:tetratricopeptide (TPR) repeat protein
MIPRWSLLVILGALLGMARTAMSAEITYATGACGDGESWTFGEAVAPEWRGTVRQTLTRRIDSARSFSEALALRRSARTPEARAFAEYWVSRSLIQGRLPHVAFSGFAQVAAQAAAPGTLGVRAAALECVNRLHRRYPSFKLPVELTSRVPALLEEAREAGAVPAAARARDAATELAFRAFLSSLTAERRASETPPTSLRWLEGAGLYERFALAFWSARRGDHATTIRELERAFRDVPALPEALRAYHDHARITLARALYTVGRFDDASAQLKLVLKSSNELAKALQELSWSYLLAERYGEAIGTALSLQAGGLRNTFAPESPMVMAMALNEICQYPESLKAVATFKRSYEQSFRWLDTWVGEGGKRPLYPLAAAFVRRQAPPDLPSRVAGEWVRSPLYISHQDEINLVIDERDAAVALGRAGSREEKKIAQDVRALVAKLKPKLRAARAKTKPGEALPSAIVKDLAQLKEWVTAFRRLRAGAPVWRTVLARHRARVPGLKQRLVETINADLRERSLRMHLALQEIAENNQLIEVEIYQGASQDIVWQNAHSDYKEVAARGAEETSVAGRPDKVWDWGRSPTGSEEAAEIWEDELGSFKADLLDNCASKERYLAIKRRPV